MSDQKTIFVILSTAKNLSFKAAEVRNELRSVQKVMNFHGFMAATSSQDVIFAEDGGLAGL